MNSLEDLRSKTDELLREGLRQGLIREEEYRWRSLSLQKAKTVEEFEELVTDLIDADGDNDESRNGPRDLKISSGSQSIMNVMGERTVGGQNLTESTSSVCVMGQTVFDFRRVQFESERPIKLDLVIAMGETLIYLPEGVRIRSQIVPILSEYTEDPRFRGERGEMPVVELNGIVFMGSLKVLLK